jgi:HYR domain
MIVAGLGAAPVAQAALNFDGSPGNGVPPATFGGYTMVPSPQATGDDGTNVSDAPATATSSFSFDQSQALQTVPTWCNSNWAGGTYDGRIYYTQGANTVTITLPSPSSAFYFYAAPDQQFVPLNMQATATADNGTTVSSGDVSSMTWSCGASTPTGQFFGFYGTNGDKISSVTLTLDDPSAMAPADFTFGDFALAGSEVVVVDNDLSLSGMPSDVTVDATGPAGAVVTYTPPTATDEDTPSAATLGCSTPSGSTFAIGSTTVTCTATDADDSNGPVSQSFNVAVVGAAGQLSDLAGAVSGLGPGTSLWTKVATAQSALAAGSTSGACAELGNFVREVRAQSGRHVPAATAVGLVSAVQQIEAVLACS